MSLHSSPHDQISPRLCQRLSGSHHLLAGLRGRGSLFTPKQHRPRASEEAQTPGGIQEGRAKLGLLASLPNKAAGELGAAQVWAPWGSTSSPGVGAW